VIVMDIPVANGSIIKSLMQDRPMIFLKMFKVIALVNLTINDEPTAFGCRAFTSPERPIPCPKKKFLSLTIDEKMRPSLSPTPVAP